jgi:AraC family transcriptional regulator
MTPSNLIVPDQLPAWVPGHLTVHSPAAGWDGVSVRGYRYNGSDVEVPPMRDYLIVAYRRGATAMSREIDGKWSRHPIGPGDISLLTRAATSHWIWPKDIEVVHVYLTEDELAITCRQMYERDVAEIELLDVLKAEDPAIHRTAMLIAAEAAHGNVGSRLIVDSLACELSVHILRRHARVRFRQPDGLSGLTQRQLEMLNDRIRDRLADDLSLQDLADTVGVSRYHFARMFRQTTGLSAHEYVTRRRVERAQILLHRTRIPLRDIALQCGFSDQSHMTRVFSQRVGVTPGKYRAS